ncbi:LCP family protein [Streptomyces sp. GMY02]|uniref:LCP family protein n=1 Tax=Streptomyces sp. GMY02 TaxID=1333528 RepID=UPI001C2BEDC6|nr:LCP family protein [Streptomyces sp. GMY02]QXE34665.1 LCP family protein [Streptomyces sp. GMY02]
MTDGSSRIYGRTPGRRRRRGAKTRRRRRAARVVAWSAAVVVLLGGSGLGYVYVKLDGNLRGIDIDRILGRDRPADTAGGSQDILVLGSDSRSGANAEYGRDGGGARSDTAMIVHVYPGRKAASVVSVPRDTLIDRPACATGDGRTAPEQRGAMFNTAYEVGGAACAVKTVETMSGIRMDHYIEVDFTGFKKLVDQLGGVKVTTTRPIEDARSRLTLAPGTHVLDGEQALGLVRTRESVGDGSDLGRIQLQQGFVKALIEQVRSIGLVGSPKKLYGLADTATRAVTTDSRLDSVGALIGFADGLKDLDAAHVRMITLPVSYDPADPNRVLPIPSGTEQVWTALKQDKPIPASATKDSEGDGGDAHGTVKED